MTTLDFVLGLVFVLSTVAGVMRGFIRIGIGLASTVLAFLLAMWFYGSAGALFEPYLKTRGLSNFAGFITILCGVMIAGSLLAWLLQKLAKSAGLSWLDRLLGGAFGFLRALLVAIILVMAITAFGGDKPPAFLAHSAIAPRVIEVSRVLSSLAPKELSDGFQQGYAKLKESWEKTLKEEIRKLPAQIQ
jgi:membrane protein required for colicin V production